MLLSINKEAASPSFLIQSAQLKKEDQKYIYIYIYKCTIQDLGMINGVSNEQGLGSYSPDEKVVFSIHPNTKAPVKNESMSRNLHKGSTPHSLEL